ncbi:cytochrome P450 [Roridomyces roridus]|uniref:Cytochrome P450 n=1 Tax=Roridomyces roridus TaxID=1738132 RepID=A0AAD7FHJ7_9AGAR|nr:cytochrome P450 [Roridomyces roridus]
MDYLLKAYPTEGSPLPVISLGLGGAVALLGIYKIFNKSSLPLPPGPKGLPFIGNMLQLPADRQWIQFTEWAKQYGDVVHVSALGQHIVILSSIEAISLLERRGTIYSDRPHLTFAGTIVGWAESLPLTQSGPRHREFRKLINEAVAPRKLAEYHPIEVKHTKEFLKDLLATPEDFLHLIKRVVACSVFEISHGYTPAKHDDLLMGLAERADHDLASAIVPGKYLCDIFPILCHLPSWMGFRWSRDVAEFKENMTAMRDTPYEMIRDQLAKGKAIPSFTTSLLERDSNPSQEQELIYKWASSTLYSAGADTTISAISSFFLAVAGHPDVQKKAQEEIDRVVGSDRLPTFADRPHLPYLEGLIKEVHRWRPVGPLALPHRTSKDDVYNGLHIPAGSTIMPNNWAIMHDPAIYPDPWTFKPERYLNSSASSSESTPMNPDPRRFAFGYGRRVCPGRDLADDMLFIAASMVLAVFDLEKRTDGFEYTGSVSCHPMPFKCGIKPRSKRAEVLILGE